ncbi:MAG: metallophosphoesterase [Nanoarchaeota archaeon]
MKKYEFLDKALWFPVEKVLVISDLHVGYEESLNSAGVFLPRFQFDEMISDLKRIFKKTGKVKEVIINGDLKHEFGKISEQEWKETLEVLDFLQGNSGKVVLVKGNHDKILEPIARRNKIEVVDSYVSGDTCFVHGDKLISECFDEKIKRIVLGHRHPAVTISDKYKKERYKCFLVGKYKKKEVIIMPSFFSLVEGTDIIDSDSEMLFIPEEKLKNFEVYVVGDKLEALKFGKLKDLE